jgi:hypothetical protein
MRRRNAAPTTFTPLWIDGEIGPVRGGLRREQQPK